MSSPHRLAVMIGLLLPGPWVALYFSGAFRHVGCPFCSQVGHPVRLAGIIVACALAIMVQPTTDALGLVSHRNAIIHQATAGIGENVDNSNLSSRNQHTADSIRHSNAW